MTELETSELTNIPIHWQVSTMANETEFITDYVANGSFASLAENVNYKSEPDYAVLIRLTDFNNNYKGEFVYVDKNAYDFLKKSKLVGGEIIISNVGAYAGTVFLAPNLNRPMTLGPNSIMMNFKNGNTFYYYWLKSPMGKFLLEGIISGSAQPKFNKTTFRQMQVPVPPIPEQTVIASVLSSLDDKIGLLHRQNATLEKMAETLFRQWFVEEAKENWEEIRLGSLVEVINGVSYKSDDLNPSTTAMVTLKSFDRNGGFRMDGFKEYTGKYKDQHILKEGDLVVAHTDITQEAEVIGNPVMVIGNPKYETLVFSMDLVKVISKSENYTNEFLYLLMKSREFKEHCLGYSNGSTVLHLSKKAIPEYEMKLPPDSLINEFSKKVKPLVQKQFRNQTQIRTLTALRDTLLPKLMSGEITVQL
jgi:type I restriction enzyme S subunit